MHPSVSGSFLVAATSADAHISIWSCSGGAGGGGTSAYGAAAWHEAQRIPVGTKIQHCVALTDLPGAPGWLALAAGGTDSVVRLYTRAPPAVDPRTASAGPDPPQQEQQPQFQLACQLTGHENWVRGLAFAAARAQQPGGAPALLLASASQDR